VQGFPDGWWRGDDQAAEQVDRGGAGCGQVIAGFFQHPDRFEGSGAGAWGGGGLAGLDCRCGRDGVEGVAFPGAAAFLPVGPVDLEYRDVVPA
jgi:hypothetical protein